MVCSRCILGVQDYPEITFDEKGVCSICQMYDEYVKATIIKGKAGEKELERMIHKITLQGRGKKYDCILGVSGGLDSTYLAYLAKQWGLRPLLVHVDNGWNSALSVKNIELLVKKTGFDLFTYVVDWEEMRDLQLAFLKSSVLDIELPFDNVFIAALYEVARRQRVKAILCGYNAVTEGILPPNFTHYKLDSMNLRDINRKFGKRKLKRIPLIGFFRQYFHSKIFGRKIISPLNFIDYYPYEVKKMLAEEVGWTRYGIKHCENTFTRFYQEFILPKKFHVHKRKAHLSTLVCSGQITREFALEESKNNEFFNTEQQLADKIFVIKKLGITEDEFDEFMNRPIKKHTDFASYLNVYRKIRPFIRIYKRIF